MTKNITTTNIDNKISSAKERLKHLEEQKKFLIAQEQGFIAIGSQLCESLNCNYEEISLKALKEYLDSHAEEMNMIHNKEIKEDSF